MDLSVATTVIQIKNLTKYYNDLKAKSMGHGAWNRERRAKGTKQEAWSMGHGEKLRAESKELRVKRRKNVIILEESQEIKF